jgi:hypothetical protein
MIDLCAKASSETPFPHFSLFVTIFIAQGDKFKKKGILTGEPEMRPKISVKRLETKQDLFVAISDGIVSIGRPQFDHEFDRSGRIQLSPRKAVHIEQSSCHPEFQPMQEQ